MRYHLDIKDKNGFHPVQSITIGKLDFRRYTSVPKWRDGRSDGLPDPIYRGAVGEYSDADLEEFREKVQHFVVRFHVEDVKGVPTIRRAEVWDTRVSAYFAQIEDEPLEPYLSVRPVEGYTPAELVGSVTPEQAAAKQAAEASERQARATDPADHGRRARHARAKRDGTGVSDA